MKVLNFISVALISSVLTVSTAFGNNGAKAKTAELTVREQIQSSLSQLSDQDRGEVYVYFNASSKNGFELVKVTGENQELVYNVKNQLENDNISIPKDMQGNFYLKVIFADSKRVAANLSAKNE